jgi:hypothetical protein
LTDGHNKLHILVDTQELLNTSHHRIGFEYDEDTPPKKSLPAFSTIMIVHTLPHTNYINMTKRQQKSPSPTNVNAFPLEGWM